LLRNKKPLYVILSTSALSLSLSLSLCFLLPCYLRHSLQQRCHHKSVTANETSPRLVLKTGLLLHEAHADNNKSWNESFTSEQESASAAAAAALDRHHTDKALQQRSKP
jgi:hypothetical protein